MAKDMDKSKKSSKKKKSDVTAKHIIPVEIEDQMKNSYLAYAMSVIVGRALPDVRDGLKPVHRRILHAMNERAWRHDRPYVKSAKIVGEVIGNYHPHGDSAVYDTLVRMVQDFSMRVPLIDGQGNFGSVDGDPAAAYRYTEARLSQMAEALLKDIDKETVDFVPNFDNTRKEPKVLPAAWPNLLVNGSSGIAVGMATKIPPHNLKEVISAIQYLIKNPDCTVKQLMKFIPAPDFPTGGIIIGKEGLKKAYTEGRGSIKIRAVANIEEIKKGKEAIVVTEIPYEVKKNDLISKIAAFVNEKKIDGISAIRDESDRRGMRIVFELRKDANAQVVLNQLYKRTQMQISYGIIFLALVDGEPKVLNLKEILSAYLNHRKEVVIRRTKYELRKAEERAHILEGLKIALDFIDEVIKIIRGSKQVEEAREKLMKRFKLTEVQANAILDMRLQKLTSLETQKILEELKALKKKIKELKALLASEEKIYGVIHDELAEVSEKYGTDRKSEVSVANLESITFDTEDLIANEEVVINLTEGGYIKRVPLETFKRQHRGGKGVISGGKKEDPLKFVQVCKSHDNVLLFSNRGKVFYMKAYEIPEAGKDSRGKNLKGLISLTGEETITAIRSTEDISEDKFLILLTYRGIIKKLKLDSIINAKKGGVMALQFKDIKQDYLVDVAVVHPQSDIFMITQKGLALRTNISKMRAQGRSASGIIGMSLSPDDGMAGLAVIENPKQEQLVIITEKGMGKRVKVTEFSVKGRGGKGMKAINITAKNGNVVAVRTVTEDSEIILTTKSGMTIRLSVAEISVQGRSAAGVTVFKIPENDTVADISVLR
ncbi:MAG: DNA gyrase subunit A [Candidatus Hydrogenedentota bacterium]|nr:MAG: DNA gyrase subunit A [Candidatus Hydrogenedentota bacterium]